MTHQNLRNAQILRDDAVYLAFGSRAGLFEAVGADLHERGGVRPHAGGRG